MPKTGAPKWGGNPVRSYDMAGNVEFIDGTTAQIPDAGWAEFFLAGRLTGPMLVPHIVTDNAGAQVRNELNRTRSFFTLDIGMTKRFQLEAGRVLTASLGVKNLFDDFQDDLDRGPFHDSTYIYGPRHPRMIYVGLKYEF